MEFEIPFYKPLNILGKKTITCPVCNEKITIDKPVIPNNIHTSGMLSNNQYVRELEYIIQHHYNTEYAIATSSCTIGLLISLQVLKKEYFISYVDTPSFGWFSSKWAVESCGLSPIFTDINKTTWLMDKDFSVSECALPIHTFGNVIKEYDADYIVYDGAHALGSKLFDIGDATVLSLAPTKLFTACEGGIILTNNHNLAKEMIMLRDKCSRMSELNAVWALETLKHFDEILEWKKKCYYYYKNHLKGQFQEIPYHSNFNTVGFLTDMKMPPEIEFRKYYFPLDLKKTLLNTTHIYGKIVCLPTWYGVDYERVVNRINGFNGVI